MYLQPIWTQTLTIQKLDSPILAFDHGIGRIQTQSLYYIHHFNLSSIKTYVEVIQEQFNEEDNNQFSNLIIDKFQKIHACLETLTPFKRFKRWDSLGTGWKFIAGSPDANDLKIINSSINMLINDSNEQVRINREINLQMKEAIAKTQDAIKLYNIHASETHTINILFNLNLLHEKLEQIKYSISFAKLGILNANILSNQELTLLSANLVKQNITITSPIDALTYAKTSVATNNRDIALLIKMPILDPKQFHKIHIYPILQQQDQIHLANRKYLVYKRDIYMVEKLESAIFDIDDLKLDTSACIPNLLNGNTATCNHTANPIQNEIISINDRHLLLQSTATFTLDASCQTSKRNLSGSFLITYENCEIRINNSRYSNTVKNMTAAPINLSLDGVLIRRNQKIVNLSLEHLHKLHLEARRTIDFIHLNSSSLQWSWPHWTLFGGISFPIMIICFVLFYLVLSNRSPKIIINPDQSSVDVNETIEIHDQQTYQPATTFEVLRMEPQF